MYDERQSGCSRCRDMPPQAHRLRVARRVVVKIIQPRLADRDDLGMGGEPNEIVGRHVQFLIGIMRMRADGTEDVRISLGDREDRVESFHPGRNRDHLPHAGVARALDDGVALGLEIRKIQVAMGVDQHGFVFTQASGAT